jgi:tetratricopeptide (TPR) repeat protein
MRTQDTSSRVPATPRLALIAIIAIVIAGLTTLDRVLANAQQAEVTRLAQQSYIDGLLLRRVGKTNEAVEAFRKAHALERVNTEYELELLDALIAARKSDQAELLLGDVLEQEPNDGRANLFAAHLMIAKGRTADAESYYHRAIYGEWPSEAAAHRVSVRMELADFLAATGKRQELLAELLPLQEEAGKNPAAERHIAQLFLAAGSPSRAADEYRALIKQNPKDAAAYESLGEAELQRGEYSLAHEAFLSAATHKREEPSIRRQLELSSALMALDPTPRKLTSMEKYRRSLRILAMAHSALDLCITKHPELNSEQTQVLLATANDMLTNKPRTGVTNEIAEQVLDLAEKMWHVRINICGSATSPDEEPLTLIMKKLAQ